MPKNPALDPSYFHGPGPGENHHLTDDQRERFRELAVAVVPGGDVADNVTLTITTPDPETPAGDAPALEDDVSAYHKGGGYYEIPGIDEKIKGKAAAQAALDRLRAG